MSFYCYFSLALFLSHPICLFFFHLKELCPFLYIFAFLPLRLLQKKQVAHSEIAAAVDGMDSKERKISKIDSSYSSVLPFFCLLGIVLLVGCLVTFFLPFFLSFLALNFFSRKLNTVTFNLSSEKNSHTRSQRTHAYNTHVTVLYLLS